MKIPIMNIPMDKSTARSDEKEANGTIQPFTNEKGVDGPLLLTLLMGNNNNNAWARAQTAPNDISDTLNPDYCALELSSTGNDDEERIDNDPSLSTARMDHFSWHWVPRRPLQKHSALNVTLELKPALVDNEVDVDESSVEIGSDGPLLFALLLNNQNNNNNPNHPANNANDPVSDTLDPKSVTLELKPALVDNEVDIDEPSAEIGSDGPLLFALMLHNQNNNNVVPNKPPNNNNNNENNPASDTLDPRGFTLELKTPVDTPQDISANDTDQFISEGDGPLLLTMLLANQNQNNGNAVNKAAEKAIADTLDPSDTITEAISDVLEMKTRLLELKSDTITEAIPDVLEMKTQLLELHSPGNYDANSIPVILKANSQAQKAQILAMIQRRSISVSIASNDTKGNYANLTLDRAQVSAANLQSASSVALNEAQNGKLSDEQLQFWRENGYLVIPDILSDSQKNHLLKTVHEAAQVLAGGGERVQKHSYLPGQESYVSPVGRAIATLSEHGFNPNVEPLKRIQRIGCGIHRVMPPSEKPSSVPSTPHSPTAEVGARVVAHQDGCSGFTNPSSCTTFWYALEDCSTENGCLAVAPGSHRVQPITRRCIKNATGQPVFTDLEEPIYANIEGVDDSTLPKKNEKGEFEYKKLEVKAGTLILMHGNLMHRSEANKSSKSRVAFNFGVVEGEHGWLEDNYLQPYEGTTEFEKL
ncbi:phytanoyl- dioxygenase family protein [Botrytis cinerea]